MVRMLTCKKKNEKIKKQSVKYANLVHNEVEKIKYQN